MKLPSSYRLHAAAAALAALIAWSVPTLSLRAEDPAAAPAAAPEAPAAAEPTPAVEAPATAPAAASEPVEKSDPPREHRARDLVTIRAHAHLRAGETVPEMVTIMGNALVDGIVEGECVTIMGNVTVNGRVRGELVCVGGTITLGPGAVVHGEVVSVGGGLIVDPTARIHGEKVAVTLPGLGAWVAEWFQDGLGQARVLPHNHAWAWGAAAFFVFLNLLFATVFRGAVTACAGAVETRPVLAFVNGALVLLLLPVLLVLLTASIVGIPLLPVAIAGFFMAWFIGTIGIFCFCGQQFGLAGRPVLAVLVGNLIFLLLYALPIVGFAVWSVTSLMGLGAAFTAMGNRRREAREARVAAKREEQARRAQAAPPQVQTTPAPMAATLPEITSMDPAGTPPPMAAAASVSTAAASTTFVPPYSGWTPPQPSATPPAGVTVPPLPSDELNERATFWPRLLAVGLDMLAIAVTVNVLGLGLFPLWALAYHIFFWGWRGTTPGGIVMNLQIVRDDRLPMDYRVAAVRALSGVFSIVPGGLGLIWVAFDRDNQSWHDKLAGTSVIVVRKARPLI